MNTTIKIDYLYTISQEPVLAVISLNESQYLLGLRQQIHQEAMSAPGNECEIAHICVPSLNTPLAETQLIALRSKITALMPNEYYYIALTSLAQGQGLETGHTTYLIVFRNSHNTPYITLINQSTNRAGNSAYQQIFREICALIPGVRCIGSNGMINGIFPLGSIFYMCMESGVLLQQMHKLIGTDSFIDVLKNYSEQYEAAEHFYQTTHLSYQQIVALPATTPFIISLEQLIFLRFGIGSAYRASLEIEQKNINGFPMSSCNILDNSRISPKEMVKYLAGRPSVTECEDALQQNILETLPFVSMTELGSPVNLQQLLAESLTEDTFDCFSDLDNESSDTLFDTLLPDPKTELESDATLLFSLKNIVPPEPSFPTSRIFLKLDTGINPLYLNVLFDCIDEEIAKQSNMKTKACLAAEFIIKFYNQHNITALYGYIKEFLFTYGVTLPLSCLSKHNGTRKRKQCLDDEVIAQLTSSDLLQLIAIARNDALGLKEDDVKPAEKRKKKS